MAQKILRPLANGDLLDELMDLYKNNFLLFAGIAAIVQIPMSVLTTVAMMPFYKFMGSMTPGAPGSPPPDPTAMLSTFVPMFIGIGVLSLVGMVVQLISMGAITWAVSSSYLGTKPTIMQSYKAVMPRLGALLAAVILMYIAMGVGFVLCLIPGIVVVVLTAFTSEVIVLEGKGPIDALTRSVKLAGSAFWKIVVVGILAFLMTFMLSMAISTPIQMIGGMTPSALPVVYMISNILNGVVSALTTPIWVIVFVLLYYDTRVRNEGFDIEMLAQSMGAQPNTQPEQG